MGQAAMNSPISLVLDPDHGRQLSIRFRLRWRAGQEPVLEELDTFQPLKLPMGDLAPLKAETDVFVEGHAYPRAQGGTRGQVALRFGAIRRVVQVIGRRTTVWQQGRLRFSEAEPFDRIPLAACEAYGGVAGEAPYLRNGAGKGFITEPEQAEGVELPRLEEADDLLTPERLVAGAWWERPRPALFAPAIPMLFPRMALFGLATFDAPLDARLREVRDGDLPADLDARLGRAHPLAFQEAPARSRLGSLVAETEVILEGCRPGGATWRAEAPRAPRVVVTVDGQATELVARPQAIRLRPEADELCVTYAVEHKMHRAFIPGVHARIPITTQVESFVARYDAPEAILPRVIAHERTLLQGGEP